MIYDYMYTIILNNIILHQNYFLDTNHFLFKITYIYESYTRINIFIIIH